jgi:hypothetical protein
MLQKCLERNAEQVDVGATKLFFFATDGGQNKLEY